MDPGFERPIVVVAGADETCRRALRRLLADAGCEVLSASGGHEALSLCWRHRPPLLILGPALPSPSADVLAESLRRELDEDAPKIAVIVEAGAAHPTTVMAVLREPFAASDVRALLVWAAVPFASPAQAVPEETPTR